MRVFSSLKTTIFLLILIAVFCVSGTLIPQGLTLEEYRRLYGPETLRILKALDLLNVYHSWWFLSALGALALNIIACSITRLPSLRGIKPSRVGVYIVHLSVLVIIAGGLITGVFGLKGYMKIREGESTAVVLSRDKAFLLPFSVRCEDFTVSYWPDGTPRDYVSRVSFLKDGRPLREGVRIRVNHPVRFEGLTFYQSSYGKEVSFTFEVAAAGWQKKLELIPGEVKPLGPSLRLGLMKHMGDLAFVVLFEGNSPRGFWIREGEERKVGRVVVSLIGKEERTWTGLQVSHDPGAPVVFVGAGLFAFGLLVSLYGRRR